MISYYYGLVLVGLIFTVAVIGLIIAGPGTKINTVTFASLFLLITVFFMLRELGL